ncbi:sarcosine oxidase subunit gamma [bacterium]|nr:sarcosine oxidase subunit gamma [bacterium]
MSEAIGAWDGVAFSGQVHIRDSGLRGMITLRGNLASTDLRDAVCKITGLEFPDSRKGSFVDEFGLCWMSPDEVLLLLPYDKVRAALRTIDKMLEGQHFLAVDVSDARTSFTIDGEGSAIRDVLAKLTPADLRPKTLPKGEVRRTRLAQVPAAFWFHEEDRMEIVCFRSVKEYVFELLCNAAKVGSEVMHH